MNPKQFVFFVKYPYSTAVLACVWIGSATMAFLDRDLPIIAIVTINVLTTWVITWSSFRYGNAK